MNIQFLLIILVSLTTASDKVFKCRASVSASDCTKLCACNCDADEVSCTLNRLSCHQIQKDTCTQACYCEDPPPPHPVPTIHCARSISTQFCFEDCKCGCETDEKELECKVDDTWCPEDSAQVCEKNCDCVGLIDMGRGDL
ncbi:hypothetical protein N431DRAFT_437590 [Stipitochalara longipes BDJ]|nr:hypothetical protein N431DRAFT_437590 [Stipitochalara longipes BDJ]